MSKAPHEKRTLGWVSIITIVLFCCAQAWEYRFWDFDDGFIVYRVARNILDGNGWVYNVGQNYNASTSVLNTVLVVLLGFFTNSIVVAAHVLSASYMLGCALLIGSWIARRSGSFYGTLAGALTIVFFSHASVWGLEVPLFAFLMLLFAELERQRKPSYWVLALAILARPDALVLLGLKVLCDLIKTRKIPVLGLVTVGVMLAPWAAFSLSHFGQLFPATLEKKRWQGASGLWGSGHIYFRALYQQLTDGNVRALALDLNTFIGSAGVATVLALGLQLIGSLKLLELMLRTRSFWYVPAFVLLQQIAYVFLNVPGYHWYFCLLNLTLLIGICTAGAQTMRAVLSIELPAYAAPCVLLPLALWAIISPPQRDVRNEAYRQATETIEHQVADPGSLAAVEVGTIGYASKRPILDLTGLASKNPEFLTRAHIDEFFERPPRVVVLHSPEWHFERSVSDDVRFKILYGSGTAVPNSAYPLTYYVLDSEHEKLVSSVASPKFLSEYAAEHFPPFEMHSFAAAATIAESCIVDLVNGQLTLSPEISVQKPLLSFTGWALDKAETEPSPEVYVVIEQSPGNGFALQAKRTERADVAQHFGMPEEHACGFDAQGTISNVPPGRYSIFILQKRGANSFVRCDGGKQIIITRE